MVDVVLQRYPGEQHDHHVATGLEDALVVPAGMCGGDDPGDPIVFAQKESGEQLGADGGVGAIAAHGEQGVALGVRNLLETDRRQRREFVLDPSADTQ